MGSFFSSFIKFNKEANIVMVGLDSAGKTTILYKLRLNETLTTVPTLGFNVENIKYKNLNLTVWDIGGQEKIRRLWQHYYKNTSAVIFVIDSSDEERFDEAKNELFKIVDDDLLKNVPILILANKSDLPNSIGIYNLTTKLDIKKFKFREYFIQHTNAITGNGLYDGLDWLAKILNKN